METFKLKAFVVLAEELNFRRSAEILAMSQPPLTRLITGLEKDLGVTLFTRTTRNVKLTGAGVFFLKEAREILEKMDHLEKNLRFVGKLKSGHLKIGFSATTFLACLPQIIGEFQDRFPKIKIELQQDSPAGLLKKLKSGIYDLSFIEGLITDPQLGRQAVHDQALGVLVAKKHPLAQFKQIEFKDLKNETIIMHPKKEASAAYDTFSELFKQNKISPKIYIKNENESCPILVSIGKGVSLTVLNGPSISFPGVKFIPIQRSFMPVAAYWLPENENPGLNTFLSFVSENAALQTKDAECLMDVMRL